MFCNDCLHVHVCKHKEKIQSFDSKITLAIKTCDYKILSQLTAKQHHEPNDALKKLGLTGTTTEPVNEQTLKDIVQEKHTRFCPSCKIYKNEKSFVGEICSECGQEICQDCAIYCDDAVYCENCF